MFFTPQILVHQKTKPQNFCEKADMKLRWKQVRILHGPATVRKEFCQRSHWYELIPGRQAVQGYPSQETCINRRNPPCRWACARGYLTYNSKNGLEQTRHSKPAVTSAQGGLQMHYLLCRKKGCSPFLFHFLLKFVHQERQNKYKTSMRKYTEHTNYGLQS